MIVTNQVDAVKIYGYTLMFASICLHVYYVTFDKFLQNYVLLEVSMGNTSALVNRKCFWAVVLNVVMPSI